MKIILMRKPLVAAIAACVLGSVSLPALSADDAVMKRMEMLEQELKALKSQMQKQEVAVKSVTETSVKVKNGGSLTFGGYLKADYRHVSGSAGYQDYWRGNSTGSVDTDRTGFNVKESRLNAKYTKGDVVGFVEMDFYGGDGNELVSNSTNPRLRHAFIKTGKWLVGQTWTTLTPIKAFPEALDFGGPIVGEVFVRQPQIRYTDGNFSVALESPETWGDGDIGLNAAGGGATDIDSNEPNPDLIATYKFNGDWGEVQVGALVRKLDVVGGDKTSTGVSVGGRLNVGEKDDFRFQVNLGETGRYVGAGMHADLVADVDSGEVKVEETTAYTMAYRHFWSSDWRSTAYYGSAETDAGEIDRSHWGVNLIRQINPDLSVGVELGNFAIDDKGGVDADSDYLQLSWKYDL